jgi:hypothetical protein
VTVAGRRIELGAVESLEDPERTVSHGDVSMIGS